jgi:hypothetical protein
MKNNVLCRIAIGLGLGCLLTVSSVKADAAPLFQSFSCTSGIQQIVWDGGALYIDCIGQPNRFVAYTTAPCSGMFPISIDTIKIFESMATSALLSGKLLIISYATPASCQGTNGAINFLTLSK